MGLFCVALFTSYVAGVGAVVWRLEVLTARNETAQGGAAVPAYLDVPAWLVPSFDDSYAFHRYPSWSMTDPGFYVPVLIVAMITATLACVASRRIPLWAAFRHIRGVKPHDRRIAALRWRVMLGRCASPRWLWVLAGAAGGIFVALVGDAWAMIAGHISQEAAWARGAPASAVFMKPVVGTLAVPDAVMLVAWCVLAPGALVVMRSRARFMEREARLGTRCMRCGYPRAAPTGPCVECGRRPAAVARPAVVRSVAGVVLGVVFVTALLAFIVSPYIARS